MKKVLKNFLATSLSLVMAFSTVSVQGNEQSFNLYLNNQEVTQQFNPIVRGQRAYLTVENIGDFFDANAMFNSDSDTVTVIGYGKVVSWVVGSTNYTVDGETFTSELTPIKVGDDVYLSLSVMGEILGKNITWNQQTKSIFVELHDEDFDELESILKGFFELTDDEIAELTEEDIEMLLDLYHGIENVETEVFELDEELMAALEEDIMNFTLEIMESEEFIYVLESVLGSEEFQGLISEIANSKNLENFLLELYEMLDVEQLFLIYNEMLEIEELKLFLEEAKTLPSYEPLVEKYGEEFIVGNTTPLDFEDFSEDLFNVEDINKSIELLQDPNYYSFVTELYTLDSYRAYEAAITEAFMAPELQESLIAITENIIESEHLLLFVEEIMESEYLEKLVENISNMPEATKLGMMYMEGIMEISSKYSLY